MPENLPPRTLLTHKEQISALCVSMILHLCLLALFALLIIPQRSIPSVTTTVSRFSLEADQVSTIVNPLPADALSKVKTSAESSLTHFLQQVPENESALNLSDFELPVSVFEEGLLAGSLNEQVSQSASASNIASEPDTLTAGREDGDAGTGFFGMEMVGSKVVYVVDSSRSMNYPYPGEAKTRFGRVKLELLHTIARMDENQKFFMLFFNHSPIPMPANRLVEATTGSRAKYLKWMTYLKAVGNTEPEKALLIALSLKPEVIYFLTDGDFDYRVVPNVSKANRTGVVINTIGFGDDRGELFLKELAARNSGEYRFIPGGEIPTSKSIVSQLKTKTQAQQERQ